MASGKNKPPQVSINMDTTPILYTDNINMSVNKNGAVINIMQNVGDGQVRVVARVGMSRDHAREFVEKFGKLLLMHEGGNQTKS